LKDRQEGKRRRRGDGQELRKDTEERRGRINTYLIEI
jgi:hypothetical protein